MSPPSGPFLDDQKISAMSYQRRQPVATVDVPYIHPKIDISKLHQGKILPKEKIQALEKQITEDGIHQIENRIYIRDQGAIYAMPPESELGRGAFGEVHLMQNLKTNEWIVVKKQIPSSTDEKKNLESVDLIFKENDALKKAQLHRFDYNHLESNSFFTGMQLVTGASLKNVINETRAFPTVRWVDMAISMADSLQNIHNAGLLHCDIKPANMNFDPATHAVTHIDLGLSSVAKDKQAKENVIKGSQRYMAPEIRHGRRKITYNEKTEVYALGMSMAEMFGFFIAKQIERLPDPPLRELVTHFLEKTLHSDPDKRPTLAEVKEFFQTIREDLLSAPSLLNHVIVLDLKQYNEATSDEKQKMIAALKEAHEVWLADDDKKNEAQYPAIRRELEDQGIIINRQVIQKQPEIPLANTIKDYAITREVHDKNIYICGSVNKNGVVDYPGIVSERHLEKITKSLQQDLDRLKIKYPKSHTTRKNAIQGAINQLQKKPSTPIKYNDLEKALNDLQNNLHSKHCLRRFTAKLTDSAFQESRKKVQSLKEEVTQVSKATHKKNP